MAEVIGILSGTVGIAAFVLQAVRDISNLAGDISDGPRRLQQLEQELYDLQLILSRLERLESAVYKDGKASELSPVVLSVKTCHDELERLKRLLEPLLPKPGGERIKLFQRMKTFLKDGEIKDAVSALQSRKLSLCLALMTNWSRFGC
jgi:hypothetical protein